ncbi:hypothetical protein HHI36_019245 [Cryptolaemus montrouzieri]|uniref:Uncharacterized protein n=1 Tax=Cryptolaemus montrouzieri TaxID=559131 RepID=A0ABD2P298_9CUCU
MKVHWLLIGTLFFVASFGEYNCIKCKWCFTESVDNPCRLGESELTCEGKLCYSYMYDLKYRNHFRQSYFRGCTSDRNKCGAAGQQNCTLCDNDFCNGAIMPKKGDRSLYDDEYDGYY